MAFRDDVAVDWEVSPRIITVAAPSDEITTQDLHDTLRTLEALPSALDDPSIVESSGKEVLTTTTRVGLTVTLLNARLAFEARSTPPFVLCRVTGGNLVALDDEGYPVVAIEPTAYVSVNTQASSAATLTEPSAETIAVVNDGLMDGPNVESGITLRGALRLLLAVAAGNRTATENNTMTLKAAGGTKDRIVGTVVGSDRNVTTINIAD